MKGTVPHSCTMKMLDPIKRMIDAMPNEGYGSTYYCVIVSNSYINLPSPSTVFFISLAIFIIASCRIFSNAFDDQFVYVNNPIEANIPGHWVPLSILKKTLEIRANQDPPSPYPRLPLKATVPLPNNWYKDKNLNKNIMNNGIMPLKYTQYNEMQMKFTEKNISDKNNTELINSHGIVKIATAKNTDDKTKFDTNHKDIDANKESSTHKEADNKGEKYIEDENSHEGKNGDHKDNNDEHTDNKDELIDKNNDYEEKHDSQKETDKTEVESTGEKPPTSKETPVIQQLKMTEKPVQPLTTGKAKTTKTMALKSTTEPKKRSSTRRRMTTTDTGNPFY